MDIVVIGLGYVGLIDAVILAGYHQVAGYDNNRDKIQSLQKGEPVLNEPGLSTLMAKNAGHLFFSFNPSDCIPGKAVALIAVDTPESQNGSADLTHFYDSLDNIAKYGDRDMTVIIRSTVPVGTNRLAQQYLNNHGHCHFTVISHPEFLSQGQAVSGIQKPYRLVFGIPEGASKNVINKLYAFYRGKKIPFIYTRPESAELIKYASNNFLALKISYINEIARLAEKIGADVTEVAAAMGLDPRIGPSFLNAGLGYGGSCFPKDTKALNWLADKKHAPSETLKATIKVNQEQPLLFAEKIATHFGGTLSGKKIAILGLAFKGETTDVRNSQAYPLIERLLELKAEVVAYDRSAIGQFRKKAPQNSRLAYSDELFAAMKGADAVVIANDARELRNLKAADFVAAMEKPVVFDGRNIYKLKDMISIEYNSIGR